MFSKQFRVTLFTEEELDLFISMADEVGLALEDAHSSLDEHDGLGLFYGKYQPGEKLVYLSDQKIGEINRWLGTIAFPVAFQVAALMQNGLLNPIEIGTTIRSSISKLLLPGSQRTSDEVAELLFHFTRAISSWTIDERLRSSLEDLFNRFKEGFWKSKSGLTRGLKPGWFRCYRATITPTNTVLSGPSQEQSNGIIRRYSDPLNANKHLTCL